MLLVAILILLISFYFFYVRKFLNYWKDRNVKHLPPVLLFGNSWNVITRRETFYHYLRRLYNEAAKLKYFGFHQMTTPTLLIRDLDLIKRISVKDFDTFTDHRTFFEGYNEELWTKNLLQLKGDKWKEMRSNLSPAFTATKMKVMFELLDETALNFINYYLKRNDKVVEVKEAFGRYTTDVIANCIYGVKCNSLESPKNEFYLHGQDFARRGIIKNLKLGLGFLAPKLQRFIKPSFVSENVSNFFYNVAANTIKIRKEQNISRPDIMHLLMHNKELSMMDIAAQGLLFFSGGSESVANTIAFLAYELAIQPEIQKKLQDEIDIAAKKYKNQLNYDVIVEMKYLDMVISEALRKWPPFMMVDRICNKTYKIEPENPDESELTLVKGDSVIFPIVGLHYDPELFPDPEKFDPERFSDENKGNIRPYSYIAFGSGPRNCIGSRFALLDIKVLIYRILCNFNLTCVQETEIPVRIGKRNAIFALLTPENSIKLGFERRNH